MPPLPTSSSTPMSSGFPRGREYDPWQHAESIGVTVVSRPLEHANELWFPDRRMIILKSGMRPAHQRNALAHGVAHAVLGHRDDRPKHERQADRYAAWHLIDPRELAALGAWARDPGQLAAELGVTRRLLLALSQR